MPPSNVGSTYSSGTGIIFLFNLIVGTGALALPGTLQTSGWATGIILLVILAFFSFITVTFVVEALSVANAIGRKRVSQATTGQASGNEVEETPLVPQQSEAQQTSPFEMKERYEVGQMALMLTPKWCQIFIYISLCVYLYGDLTIYSAAIGKTVTDIICNEKLRKQETVIADEPCMKNFSQSQITVYRISIAVFAVVIGPLLFFNVQKTKFLQYLTLVMRWCAFFIMIGWSIQLLSENGQQGDPTFATYKGFPTLFGALVYAFMCQHSIPGVLVPIRNKNVLVKIISLDYFMAAVFYVLLSMTAIFTFERVDVIYTSNFWHLTSHKSSAMYLRALSFYLALFPVFTLSTNFPIIAITLRNNLRNMVMKNHPPVWYYDKFLFPLITLIPPITLAIAVSDLHLLVGVIGSYCGACVQYLIPSLLVTFARPKASEFNTKNRHESPFKCKGWVYAVYVWFVLSLIFITTNYVLKFVL